jgi:hypothetical protein
MKLCPHWRNAPHGCGLANHQWGCTFCKDVKMSKPKFNKEDMSQAQSECYDFFATCFSENITCAISAQSPCGATASA